ncbi:MAG: DUF928 domain-containing protein [Syntrophobacteraceae bacterium]
MRKRFLTLTCLVLAAAFAVVDCPSSALSEENDENTPVLLVYTPPLRGAPAGGGRIAAAVRGDQSDNPTVVVLAPNDVGAVSNPQPVLYWYISGPTTCRLEFTLNDEIHQKTLVDAYLPCPAHTGIQAIKLSDFKAELSPGVVYKWFVTLEADPSQPAKDVYSGGSIIYLKPPPDLEKSVQAAGVTGAARIYAGQGFWYDAFYAARARGKKGEDEVLRQEQISLLKQVGYGAAAPGKGQSALTVEKNLLQYMSK